MKKILLLLLPLLTVLIIIQFFQPARNQNGQAQPRDIAQVYAVPQAVKGILAKACYDCHSNNTRYPWYASLQPMAWWMASHIRKGKAALNFNEFANYSRRRQLSKLKSMAHSIADSSMPLPSYTWLHKAAVLSGTERQQITVWLQTITDSLSQNR